MTRDMTKIDPIEIKIFIVSIVGTIVLDFDLLLRFLAPLLSAVVWFYLKPLLEKVKLKIKAKRAARLRK